VVVTCSPAQVAVEYCVAAGGLLVAAWCSTLVVEMVVGTTTVSTLGGLVAGHAYICRVAEFEAVLAHCVLVIGVHVFCFARPVVDAPGGLFSWDAAWDCKGWFCLKGCHYCYESALGFAGFYMFPVSKELYACWGGCCICCDLSP